MLMLSPSHVAWCMALGAFEFNSISARSDASATERACNTTVLCPGWDDRARPSSTIWEKEKDNLEIPDEMPDPISDCHIERRLSSPKRVNRSLGREDTVTDSTQQQ